MIHCIGDSHVSVFSGLDKLSDGWPYPEDSLPFFRTYRTGAYLAYSIGDTNHVGYTTLKLILSSIPKTETILLSYGEVDCRVHIVKQSEDQGRSIKQVAEEVVTRYSKTITLIRNDYEKVIVYTPVASSSCYNPNAAVSTENAYPHIGRPEQRNLATQVFSTTLKETFKDSDVIVLSIFDRIVDKNLLPVSSYFRDGVHLSQKAMPFILEALNKQMKEKWNLTL